MDAVLTIGEVARRTGMNPSTLRAWERRYGLLRPERTEGGHRRYSTADVARVTRTLELIDEGWAVEAAARHVGTTGIVGSEADRGAVGTGSSEPRVTASGGGAAQAQPTTVSVALAEDEEGLRTETSPTAASAEVDAQAVAAAYLAARRLLRMQEPTQAGEVLTDLVRDLGGDVVTAEQAGDEALPIDIAVGLDGPLLPTAPPMSLARMRVEFLLPELVESARRMVDLLRASRS